MRERGHAPSARRLIDDVIEFARSARSDGPVVLGGISWGGKLVMAASAEAPEAADLIALICPGLHPRVGVSPREKLGVGAAVLTGRAASRTFSIPLADPALFTDDPEARRFIASDPLSLRAGTAGLMFASRILDRLVRRAPGLVTRPTLLMLAGRDRIVDNRRTRDYFERIASPRKTVLEYPDSHHTLDFELDPTTYARDLVAWIESEAGP
jgi:alpha-beta hydrolase superfamily lysophospholipase